ncbi:MAG: TonB-dependent receptor, partial [Paramuribaculum sp.]|nr:TonB-dependent receptor [Paramuribaculum sp.]
MSHIFRRLAMMCVIVPAAIAAIASDITGRIKDDTGEVLPDATVKLLSLPDSTFVKGIQANDEGKFRLTGVKRGQYVAEVSYVGYATQGVNVKVDGKNNVALGDISLSEGTINLKDVVVTGVKTQIKVMEDTVEYNADSYKTAPNAVVEDLLKRLPGVEVDSEGKITANGKEVTKILIDGKEFFSDDPKVASKNLPVNMVDKLQVVDRKSDLARLTGVDDGEDETVINLTVKKGMQNGWFGTAEAGYGTDNRYLGSFNVNRFWNGNQITLLGNANNINELGFTDSNGGRFRRFGGDNGITTSQALGLNFNIGNEEIFRVGGDIMYSRSDRDTRQKQERQYLFPDSSSYASIGKNARDKGHNFRADFRLEWRPDSFNILEVRPRISYNKNESFSVDSTLTRAGDPLRTPVSNSFNNSQASGKSLEFGTRIIYTHNFASHRGRSFSLMANYQHSDVKQYDDSYSRNLFYLFNDSTDIYDQWTDSHEWSNTLMARASWTEPIGDVRKGNFLTFAYHIRYRWNDADKLVYDREMLPEGVIDQPALVFNDSLSNSFRNEFMTQNIRVGYKKVGRDFNFEGGLALVPSMSQSTDLINSARNIPRRNVWNYAPFLRMKLKMSKTRSLNMRYDGRSSQPSMAQLQPVADMSDPLRIVV